MPKANQKASANGTSEMATPFAAVEVQNSALSQSNVPVLIPSGADGQMGVNANVNGKKVLQTWGIDQNRNFWANIETVGYKKVDDANDASSMAYAQILTSARTTNTNVDVIIDDTTGKITQVYAW